MDKNTLKSILENVAGGKLSVDEAVTKFKTAPFEDLGFAKVDYHRSVRQGTAEVIYGEGKNADQIIQIADKQLQNGQKTVLITRINEDKANIIQSRLPLNYHNAARIGVVGEIPAPETETSIVIATGGTSDIPVAEEAAITAEALGNKIIRLYDIGVSGIHRLLAHSEEIMTARVIIAVAGMEGALASVIGGLADCPVIAVPTSIGYGAAFGGIAALLSMLNSCASGVSVVNIDNGFGAGYLASMINHIGNS